MEAMLVENMQRKDLSDYELGRWFKLIMEKYPEKFPNQEAVADRFNISRQLVGYLIAHYEAIEQIKQTVSPNIATRVAMLPEQITREVRRAPSNGKLWHSLEDCLTSFRKPTLRLSSLSG
jgi:ParB-like chromosome segregation protein Spo0J